MKGLFGKMPHRLCMGACVSLLGAFAALPVMAEEALHEAEVV